MYLRLGNTQIKYNSSITDFIVIGEVLSDATIGYESPVLVHSLEELDIWFGKEFKDREYLAELLRTNTDLSLYLSRPISPVSSFITPEDYYDLENYEVDPGIYYGEDMFPTEGKSGIIYRVVKDVSGKEYEEYIWTGFYYIPVKELPQENISRDSISYLNRDTLRLGWKIKDKDEIEWGYSHPSIEDIDTEEIPENIYNFDWGCLDENKIEEGEETLAFSLKIPEEETFNQSGNYVLLGDVVLYTGYSIPISNSYYSYSLRVTSPEMFIQAIKGELIPPTEEECKDVNKSEDERDRLTQQRETYLGINSRKWMWEDSEDDVKIIWKTTPTQVTYFYQWPEINLEPDHKKTQEILSSRLIPAISFWSRTIGRCREEDWDSDNIHILIEPVTTNIGYWRATITRYDYVEVFEGTINPSPYRLDFMIEQGSKLVHAYIPDSITEQLTELPTGTYQLKGAVANEKGDLSKKLQKTLEMMLGLEDKDYFPDFILIPDPEVWMNEGTSKMIYEGWLRIATEYSLQFLIQNNLETLPWNLTTDKENRLVWFWEGIKVGGEERPGYYLFLNGLLLDQYSRTAKYISYNLPVTNPYSESTEDLEKQLIKQKSNYLVCNNQMYYYKEYQNGENPETTIWMRFTMGKITRELEKNVGLYLGEQTVGRLIESIENILKSVASRFTIIRSISISSFDVDYQKQIVDLVIDTTISDLIQNNMSLDVVINYSKS